MRIITVLPFNVQTARHAERLCDLIFWQGWRRPVGHCLLIADPETHAELREKVSIAAEVAFASIELVSTAPGETPLVKAMLTVQKRYKQPWVYLEPDCVPLHGTWREQLIDAYEAQPKRYMGPHLKSGETMLLSRVSVYPENSATDLNEDLLPLSSKSRLIQHMTFDGDMTKVRKDAVILDGDPSGKLIEQLIESTSETLEAPKTSRRKTRATSLRV